jgi:choline transport protein
MAFPAPGLPVSAPTMNYNCVILAGVLFITAAWWFIHAGKNYPGPKVMTMYIHDDKQASDAPLQDVIQGQEAAAEEKKEA